MSKNRIPYWTILQIKILFVVVFSILDHVQVETKVIRRSTEQKKRPDAA